MERIQLIDLFSYYKRLPHQMAALSEMEQQILAADPKALDRDRDWFKTWSQAGKQAQEVETPNSWWGVYKAAQRAGAKYPELASAQWALESGWGQHTSGTHNYVGLKGKGTPKRTNEVVNGRTITITASFIDFASLQDCIDYLVTRWYKDWHGYKGCNNAPDRYAAAEWLKRDGYATDPSYVAKLCELMRKHAPDAEQEAKPAKANPLVGVPRYTQRDSAQVSQRDRTCFSSSCAMLLETVKPGTLKGSNGDDQYLAVVQRFGDTTDANAQLRALAHFGVTARLIKNADFLLLEQQISRGIPVPCGYIHRGPVDRPSGGGHWLIVYGHTPSHVIVNDPWGEPNLVTGATLSASGMGIKLSRLHFGKRWMVDPIGGAYRYAPSKGWSIVVDSIR